MATTTPNYGWPVPTNTDYVKDGANAISDLGDAIDATVFALPSGGVSLIKSYTVSAVSSLSLDADTFSATYRNYKIVINLTNSTNSVLYMRLRAAGTDNTTTNYSTENFQANSTTIQAYRAGPSAQFETQYAVIGDAIGEITMFNPQGTIKTGMIFSYIANGNIVHSGAGGFSLTTSFDSMTLYPSTGTFTGNVSVYGYAI